jgi:large subunit ribosomal protein L17
MSRHKSHNHGFGRKLGPKMSLFKGLVISLVEHERIVTTLAKAKEIRGHVEKAITLGKDGSLNSRRTLISKFGNVGTAEKIIADLSVRFKTRPGGYTRIIKVTNRPGDQAKRALIEFVDYKLPDASAESAVKGDKEAKKRIRLSAKLKAAKKKNIRKMKEASRKVARNA